MRSVIIAVAAVAVFAMPAMAGNKNTNNNSSSSNSSSSSVANSRASGNTTTFNDRLQAPGLGSFGGGGCPEGLMLSVPGGGIGFQTQCAEYKRSMEYQMINRDFGRDGSRRWQCEANKKLYTLPACRAYRMENARTPASRRQ